MKKLCLIIAVIAFTSLVAPSQTYGEIFNAQNWAERKIDPETGCSGMDESTFELCRQSYFLKQQNQILQNKQSNPKPEETNAKLETTTNTQATDNYTLDETAGWGVATSPILYILILIVAVVATAIITKRISRK